MSKPTIQQQLDELAQTQPGAFEAALEEMVHSGFGDLHSQLPPDDSPLPYATPQPAAKMLSAWGWW
jgi:hypothetical protein